MTRDEELARRASAVLTTVVDPCSIAAGAPIDLHEMGLVTRVACENGHVVVGLRLTSPFCLQVGIITERINEVIAGVEGVTAVRVEVDASDEWLPHMMASAARDRLRSLRPG